MNKNNIIPVIINPTGPPQWIPSKYVSLKGYKYLGPLQPLYSSECNKISNNIPIIAA